MGNTNKSINRGYKIIHKKPTATFGEIGPIEAQKILEKMAPNRNIKPSAIEGFAIQMLAGEWRNNGQGIIIDQYGRLLDGQNRLKAIILSNKRIKTLIIKGIDYKAFTTMDIGIRRSGIDTLTAANIPNANIIAPALKYYFAILTGHFFNTKSAVPLHNISKVYLRPGNKRVLDLINIYPDILDYLITKTPILTPSLMTMLRYLFININEDKGNEFISGLLTGVGLTQNNPIYKCRERIIKEQAITMERRPRGDSKLILGMVFKSWNFFINGEKTERLIVKKTEKIPLPLGLKLKSKSSDWPWKNTLDEDFKSIASSINRGGIVDEIEDMGKKKVIKSNKKIKGSVS